MNPTNRNATLAGLISILLATGCNNDAEVAQAEVAAAPTPVKAYTLAEQDIRPYQTFVGSTKAFEEVNLQARVSGIIVKRHFKEGDLVNKGDVLFEIDATPYQITLLAAEAEYEKAKSAKKIAEARNNKAKDLAKKKTIGSHEALEYQNELYQTIATVKAAKANYEQAKLQLEFTKVTAPISGRTGSTEFGPGDLVNAHGQGMVSIVDANPIYVSIAMPEQEVLTGTLDNDRQFNMKMSNGNAYAQVGKINMVDNRVDAGTGTVQVRIEFNNDSGLLVPGQYVNIEMSSGEGRYLAIPQRSVVETQMGRSVMVVGKDGVVTPRIVTMGQKIGTQWIVESGLAQGEQVVTDGLQVIAEGMSVTTEGS